MSNVVCQSEIIKTIETLFYSSHTRHTYQVKPTKDRTASSWFTDMRKLSKKVFQDALYNGDKPCIYGMNALASEHFIFDIDKDSRYHNESCYQILKRHMEDIGLIAIRYQSSDSGGWHVYFHLSAAVDCTEMQETIKRYLVSLGYIIANGTLEIYPTPNKCVRLPFQSGFMELEHDDLLLNSKNLFDRWSRYLHNKVTKQVNWQEVKSLIDGCVPPIANNNFDLRSKRTRTGGSTPTPLRNTTSVLTPQEIKDRLQRAQGYMDTGLTAHGQTHDAVLCLGLFYYRKGYTPEQRIKIILEILTDNHNGFCTWINKQGIGSSGLTTEVESACKWGMFKYRKVGSKELRDNVCLTPEQMRRANERSHQEATKRHIEAYYACKQELNGEEPTMVMVAKRAGGNRERVTKSIRMHLQQQISFEQPVENSTKPVENPTESDSTTGGVEEKDKIRSMFVATYDPRPGYILHVLPFFVDVGDGPGRWFEKTG